ncbi:MAG TPA: hypothetical protein VGK46_01385 [Saprospiraceae bacterium]
MIQRLTWTDWMFASALLVSFIPILTCDFIVTSDGPCHFYNSQILVSWLIEGQGEFYKPFLQLNQNLEPNWITNALQVPLLKIVPSVAAERIFFALYLLGFAFGLRKVILLVNPQAGFLVIIGIVFAWNLVLMKGFTNNAWSIVIWFWLIASWIKLLRSNSVGQYLIVALLFFLLYLAHPIGLIFGLIASLCLLLGWGVFHYRLKGWRAFIGFIMNRSAVLMLCSFAPAILFISFYLRHPWSSEANAFHFDHIFMDLLRMPSLINLSFAEQPLVYLFSILMNVLLVIAIVGRIRKRELKRFDGMLILFLSSLFIIFNPPSSVAGGLEVSFRLGLFVHLSALFWMATHDYSKFVQVAASVWAMLIITGMMYLRWPIHRQASAYASEIMEVSDSIDTRSTLLVLNYDWSGKTPEGQQISDRAWLFTHVDCYLGISKDLAISDNYEANFWYFPLIERWETNMYFQTDKDKVNFDNRPPRADFNSYKRRTGQYIDYVLMLSYRDEFAAHPYTQEIFNQLDTDYIQISRSEHGRAILYKRQLY